MVSIIPPILSVAVFALPAFPKKRVSPQELILSIYPELAIIFFDFVN
jgi:hypothetical protein